MLRIMLLPLVLFTLSMACMGQTFQYSRGWTNGKRASSTLPSGQFHQDDADIIDILQTQNYEHKFQKCLQYIEHYLSNALVRRAADYATALPLNNNNNHNKQNNDNSHLFINHHQSQDLFDELAGAGAGVETSDYSKH